MSISFHLADSASPLPLLTESDVARRLRVSLPTLRRWRTQSGNAGPPRLTTAAGSIRYDPAAVDQYLSACMEGV